MKLRLYSYWRSSSAWRVRIGLALKAIPHELKIVNLVKQGGTQHQAEYQALNPLEQVPTLEIEESGIVRRLTQSMAILEYLEERFPEPPLLPADPFLRARSRQLAEIVNSGIQPLQNRSTLQRIKHELSGDPDLWAKYFVERGLHALAKLAQDIAGEFLVGNQVTLADIYLVPQLFGARRFGVDLVPLNLLTEIEARCLRLPAFQAAQPDQQPDAEP